MMILVGYKTKAGWMYEMLYDNEFDFVIRRYRGTRLGAISVAWGNTPARGHVSSADHGKRCTNNEDCFLKNMSYTLKIIKHNFEHDVRLWWTWA